MSANYKYLNADRSTPRGYITPFRGGTGGIMTVESLQVYQDWTHDNRISDAQIEVQSIPNAPTEQLLLIRHALGLNISELSILLGVTRPTVYSWLKGKDLKKEALGTIEKIAKTAKKIEQLNIDRVSTFIHRPLFDGQSLFEKIKNNEGISEPLSILRKISEQESVNRLKLKGSEKSTPSINPSDYSTPLYRE